MAQEQGVGGPVAEVAKEPRHRRKSFTTHRSLFSRMRAREVSDVGALRLNKTAQDRAGITAQTPQVKGWQSLGAIAGPIHFVVVGACLIHPDALFVPECQLLSHLSSDGSQIVVNKAVGSQDIPLPVDN